MAYYVHQYYTQDEVSSSEQNEGQNKNSEKQYDKPFLDMLLVDASEVSAARAGIWGMHETYPCT